MIRDFAEEATALIEPPDKASRSACKSRVEWFLATLPRFALTDPKPTDGNLRKEIGAVGVTMRRARQQFQALSPQAKVLLLDAGKLPPTTDQAFNEFADRVIAMAEALVDDGGIPARRTGPSLDPLTLAAAEIACGLIVDFSPKLPTSTTDGTYHQLTRVLVESASGRRDAVVESACDAVIARIKAGSPTMVDNIELDRQIALERTQRRS